MAHRESRDSGFASPMRPAVTLSPLKHRRGITPGDEFRHDEALAGFAELQVTALRIRDLSARGGDDGVSCRDIPFAGRREAGIEIGFAFRQPAEFDRRAEHPPDPAGSPRNEGFGPYVCLRAADRCAPRGATLREGAGMDRLAP